MILDNKNILITGACGLIGGALVDALLRGYPSVQVFAMARSRERLQERFEYAHANPCLHFVVGDVNAPLNMDLSLHYIVHAASNANPNAYALDPVGTMWTNINGTRNLLEYGRTHGLERFLYVSSGEVYGNGEQTEWRETDNGYIDSMSVRSCYPSSKRAAETMCVCYAEQYGLNVVVGRPCHTYGPHFTDKDNRAYAQFVRKARAHEDIVLKSTGEQYRSWIYVEDCINGLLTILQYGENGQAYNIADEQSNVTIRAMAEMIAEIAGVKVIFDIPNEVEKKGFSQMKRAIYSTDKLRELGWRPCFSIMEGLKKTI